MKTLNIDVQEIAATVAEQVVNNIDLESVLANGAIANGKTEYRNISYVPSNATHTDKLLNAAHAMLVDSGTIFKRPFIGQAMAGVKDGVFQIQRSIEGGDIVIVSAPILDGVLNTTKVTVGNYNMGEINIFAQVARRPIKNTARLTSLYHNIDKGFKEYMQTLKDIDATTALENELNDLKEELVIFEAAKQSRMRKLASRELRTQIGIVENILAKRK